MLVPGWLCRPLMVLGAIGFTAGVVQWFTVEPARVRELAWTFGFVGPFFAVGMFAYLRRGALRISRILLLAGSLWASVGATAVVREIFPGLTGWTVFAEGVLWTAAMAAAATLLALYPDGSYRSRPETGFVRGLWLTALLLVLTTAVSTPRLELDIEYDVLTAPNPLVVPALSFLGPASGWLENLMNLALPVALVLLLLRYRRSDAPARQQMRWLLLVPVCAVGLTALFALLRAAQLDRNLLDAAAVVAQHLVLGLIPTVLLLSILRHRLLDIDVVLRRSLVYGALWTVIALGYVGTAALVGIAGSRRLPVGVAILLTIAATLVFQPARQALERLADRWVFGRRLSGYAVIGQLGRQLEAIVGTEEVLARLADAVRSGLRLEWADVVLFLRGDDAGVRRVSAGRKVDRSQPTPVRTVPLAHRGEPLGVIECGPKLHGAFSTEDDEVLATLARQAALAVHNARLASELASRLEDIQRQASELAASRARIVQAGDAERRRIERDLHDGAQQQILALMTGLRLARNQLARAPATADRTLAELEAEAASLHQGLVELTRGIHPPVLTDRGLPEAIESRAERLPLDVILDVPDQVRAARYPDEIEGAAYFVVSEALTNVLKHASARQAVVRLAVRDGRLQVEVSDDGVGFNGAAPSGTGLRNMADRLEALGGDFRVTSAPGRGTRVMADLPAAARTSND